VTLRRTLAVLLGVAALTSACAQPAPGGPLQSPRDGGPPVVLSPMSPYEIVPEVPEVSEALPEELVQGVNPMPLEMLTFQNRLHEQFGKSRDLGTMELEDGTTLIVRWHGDPPAQLQELIDEYVDAPFEIRLEGTRFRPGDLQEEAGRLVREHPGVVTGAGPRTAGDGVTVGLDPALSSDPDRDDLDSLGITSRFPLFPEAMGQVVPA
jgi:hypothetical protein